MGRSQAETASRFEAVFWQVHEPLQRYFRRRAPHADVDDLVAQVLAVLWRRLDRVPVDGELPWAYGIARRCLANHRRGSRRRLALAERAAREPQPVIVTSGDPEVHAALGRLRRGDREVLQLWAWEGLPPREIAVTLGVSPNAASIRLHRAIDRLRQELERGDRDAGQK